MCASTSVKCIFFTSFANRIQEMCDQEVGGIDVNCMVDSLNRLIKARQVSQSIKCR